MNIFSIVKLLYQLLKKKITYSPLFRYRNLFILKVDNQDLFKYVQVTKII